MLPPLSASPRSASAALDSGRIVSPERAGSCAGRERCDVSGWACSSVLWASRAPHAKRGPRRLASKPARCRPTARLARATAPTVGPATWRCGLRPGVWAPPAHMRHANRRPGRSRLRLLLRLPKRRSLPKGRERVKCQSSDSYGYQCQKAYSPEHAPRVQQPCPRSGRLHQRLLLSAHRADVPFGCALSSACPGSLPDGYQCTGPDDPTSYDRSLQCCPGALDPDGVHADYCCSH